MQSEKSILDFALS